MPRCSPPSVRHVVSRYDQLDTIRMILFDAMANDRDINTMISEIDSTAARRSSGQTDTVSGSRSSI
jgi:hypothetical protein